MTTPTPRKQKGREAISNAWQKTSQGTRKAHLWLKHSVLSSSGLSSFEDSQELDSQIPPQYQVDSVDQALKALSTYRDDFPVQDDFQEDFDWILDGHSDWQLARQRTQDLLAQLSTCPIDDEEWVLKLGRLGQQEYQFASFQESLHDNTEKTDVAGFADFSHAFDEETNESASPDNDDFEAFQVSVPQQDSASQSSDFGGFQQASESGNKNPVPTIESSDSGDFGDFQNTQTSLLEKSVHVTASLEPNLVTESTKIAVSVPMDNARAMSTSEQKETATHPGGHDLLSQEEGKGSEYPTTLSIVGDQKDQVNIEIATSNSDLNVQDDSVINTPSKEDGTVERASFATPQSRVKTHPKTPTTNNYSQSRKSKILDSGGTQSLNASGRVKEELQSTDPDSVTPGESQTFEPSVLSSGVPAVVQLFGKQEPYPTNSTVPSTVRLSQSGTTDSRRNNHPYPTNKALPKPRKLALNLDRETSVTSHTSIASPEGRFFRRTSQMFRSNEESSADSDEDTATSRQDSLGSLRSFIPENYWKYPDYDDAIEVLQSLEWDWIPYWKLDHLLQEEDCDESFIPLWLEQIAQKLSEFDAMHLKTSKKLYKLIQPHAAELEEVNRSALALGKGLQLCNMYWDRCRSSIQKARHGASDAGGDGVEGARHLLQLWDTSDFYKSLDSIIGEVQVLYAMETEIVQKVNNFDVRGLDSLSECRSILDLVEAIQIRAADPSVATLACLDELRERIAMARSGAFSNRLHLLLEDIVTRCCHPQSARGGFDPDEYDRLVHALLLVESQTSEDSAFANTFCASVHSTLLLEAQRSFGMAMLNPTDSEHEDSQYDKELLALSTSAYANPEKMSVWTANLVTIRFDFEMDKNPLPAVYHRLCWHLANVLHGQFRLLQWHQHYNEKSSECTPALLSILNDMKNRRVSIWNSCIKALEECLEEYHQHTAKKRVFQSKGEHGANTWMEDLLGLEDVLLLTNQFLTLRRELLVGISQSLLNDGSALRKIFYDIQKRHVRAVHVEAMTRVGTMLSQEDWDLSPLSTSGTDESGTVVGLLRSMMLNQLESDEKASKVIQRSKSNRFSIPNEENRHLALFSEVSNPFNCGVARELVSNVTTQSVCADTIASLSELLDTFAGSTDCSAHVFPTCFGDGILPWICKFLAIMDKLPPVTTEVCTAILNIVDLYVTTAFRICCGSSQHERVALGIDIPKRLSVSSPGVQNSQSPLFGFGRKQSVNTRPQVSTVVPSHVNAEIIAPMFDEVLELKPLVTFLLRAQESLKNIAKLDLVDSWVTDPEMGQKSLHEFACMSARVLEKRQAAAWCIVYIATILEIGVQLAKSNHERNDGDHYGVNTKPLEAYLNELVGTVPNFVKVACSSSCVHAIRGRQIEKEILGVGSGWEESKLHESPNQYVDELVDFLAFMWCSLRNANHLPIGAINTIWSQIVEAGFSALLDGFARIPYCSTEGRALMSMDLAAFSGGIAGRSIEERLAGHAKPSRPPTPNITRGMSHVDTYIKVFYFPPADALAWIKENFQNYRRNHMIALIGGAAISSGESQGTINRLTNEVDSLYRRNKDDEVGKSQVII
eukprot:Nitzschia sp. Nitz4//scaffold31_size150131//23864//28795//NITZ4_002813-RA/size150131-snap-gene-0.68-mRNA-1//1//CDS//3329547614//9155//frame0